MAARPRVAPGRVHRVEVDRHRRRSSTCWNWLTDRQHVDLRPLGREHARRTGGGNVTGGQRIRPVVLAISDSRPVLAERRRRAGGWAWRWGKMTGCVMWTAWAHPRLD